MLYKSHFVAVIALFLFNVVVSMPQFTIDPDLNVSGFAAGTSSDGNSNNSGANFVSTGADSSGTRVGPIAATAAPDSPTGSVVTAPTVSAKDITIQQAANGENITTVMNNATAANNNTSQNNTMNNTTSNGTTNNTNGTNQSNLTNGTNGTNGSNASSTAYALTIEKQANTVLLMFVFAGVWMM